MVLRTRLRPSSFRPKSSPSASLGVGGFDRRPAPRPITPPLNRPTPRVPGGLSLNLHLNLHRLGQATVRAIPGYGLYQKFQQFKADTSLRLQNRGDAVRDFFMGQGYSRYRRGEEVAEGYYATPQGIRESGDVFSLKQHISGVIAKQDRLHLDVNTLAYRIAALEASILRQNPFEGALDPFQGQAPRQQGAGGGGGLMGGLIGGAAGLAAGGLARGAGRLARGAGGLAGAITRGTGRAVLSRIAPWLVRAGLAGAAGLAGGTILPLLAGAATIGGLGYGAYQLYRWWQGSGSGQVDTSDTTGSGLTLGQGSRAKLIKTSEFKFEIDREMSIESRDGVFKIKARKLDLDFKELELTKESLDEIKKYLSGVKLPRSASTGPTTSMTLDEFEQQFGLRGAGSGFTPGSATSLRPLTLGTGRDGGGGGGVTRTVGTPTTAPAARRTVTIGGTTSTVIGDFAPRTTLGGGGDHTVPIIPGAHAIQRTLPLQYGPDGRLVNAATRYHNPGAMYPAPWMSSFGMTSYGIIGGGHKIAEFPTQAHGLAANMELWRRSYVTGAIFPRNYTGPRNLRALLAVWRTGNPYGNPGAMPPGIDGNTPLAELAARSRDRDFMRQLFQGMYAVESGTAVRLEDGVVDRAWGLYEVGGVKPEMAGDRIEAPPGISFSPRGSLDIAPPSGGETPADRPLQRLLADTGITLGGAGTIGVAPVTGVAGRGLGGSHRGADMMAPVGSPVVAIRSGRVVSVGQGGTISAEFTGGRTVRVQHDDGTIGLYLHMSGHAEGLRVGTRVEPGTILGSSGSAGPRDEIGRRIAEKAARGETLTAAEQDHVARFAHLHFELKGPDGRPLDPYRELGIDTSTPYSWREGHRGSPFEAVTRGRAGTINWQTPDFQSLTPLARLQAGGIVAPPVSGDMLSLNMMGAARLAEPTRPVLRPFFRPASQDLSPFLGGSSWTGFTLNGPEALTVPPPPPSEAETAQRRIQEIWDAAQEAQRVAEEARKAAEEAAKRTGDRRIAEEMGQPPEPAPVPPPPPKYAEGDDEYAWANL